MTTAINRDQLAELLEPKTASGVPTTLQYVNAGYEATKGSPQRQWLMTLVAMCSDARRLGYQPPTPADLMPMVLAQHMQMRRKRSPYWV